MRLFHGLLFCGNGKLSGFKGQKLHHILDLAISDISGFQQGEPRTPELQQELEDKVRDLAAALLGREVAFGAELPYPWNDTALQQAHQDSEDTGQYFRPGSLPSSPRHPVALDRLEAFRAAQPDVSAQRKGQDVLLSYKGDAVPLFRFKLRGGNLSFEIHGLPYNLTLAVQPGETTEDALARVIKTHRGRVFPESAKNSSP